mgnify:CR=1 FL=1
MTEQINNREPVQGKNLSGDRLGRQTRLPEDNDEFLHQLNEEYNKLSSEKQLQLY